MLAADGAPGTPATLHAAPAPDTVGEVADLTGRLPTWLVGYQVFARRVNPLCETTPKPCPAPTNSNSTYNWRPQAGATKPSPPTAPPSSPTKTPTRSPPASTAATAAHARREGRCEVAIPRRIDESLEPLRVAVGAHADVAIPRRTDESASRPRVLRAVVLCCDPS
jgi:hypothetical protein